jgi:hypothetical protein
VLLNVAKIHAMEFETHVAFFDSVLWGHYFPIPPEVAISFMESKNRRVLCTINQKLTKSCAIMPDKGTYFILVNKAQLEQLGLCVGDKVTVNLETDQSTYGMEMPPELEACFEQDEAGSTYFHALSPGKQRSLMYLVASVKNVDSRIRKSLALLDHLKQTKGKLDFKELNELIKQYNRQMK